MSERLLTGKTFLVTRPRELAAPLEKKLSELGGNVVSCPMIEIRPPADEVPLLDAARSVQNFDWIILTSVNGATALATALHRVGNEVKDVMCRPRIAVIGPATAQACMKYGFQVDLLPSSYIAESIFETLKQHEPTLNGLRILLPRAAAARRNLSELLKQAGAEVTDVVAYSTRAIGEFPLACQELLRSDRPVYVIFTSSSTVTAFFNALDRHFPQQDKRNITAISIGPITSATLHQCGMRPLIQAEEFSIPGLIQEIMTKFTRQA